VNSSFTHLHLHSQYSLLDGAIRLKDLFSRLQDYKMNAVALTDHGNMFGAVDFYKKAKAAGIKPIFGCEVYVTRDMNDRSAGRNTYHLILLAKNLEGYQNLAYMVSKAYLEGFYYTPRIDKKLLKERGAGLVGLTACLGGEVPQTIMNRGVKRAEEVVQEYKALFEPGSFFLELQHNGLQEQLEVNEALKKLARKTGVGLVATNDCHYLDRKDARAHDVLMCIQTGKLVDDENRMRHDTDEFFLKTTEEMEAPFSDVPEALENTAAIAAMCNVELDLSQTYLPQYQVPDGHDLDSYMEERAREGLMERYGEFEAKGLQIDRERYEARLDHELKVIVQMGFSGYFLIVWDFINYAKEIGVPVGPGRGSGAGSLVAYSLRITDIDPLPYNLLFERFLNPDRVSMPDFDIDFCMNRRDEVIHYVADKYGKNNVGQIATFHSLKARGVVRDVARVMGLSYADGDRVAKLIPEPIAGKSVSIPQALEQEPRLRELAEADPKIADLLEVAAPLEGLNRHAGMHAAGVVIGEKPLWDYVPCFKGQNGEIVTQFAKEEVEEAGLVKFDFLGLKTLTILDIARQLIEGTTGEPFDLAAIPMEDVATFEMIQAGNTTGVFQLESSGFKDLLKRLKPDRFEDIIAAVALYRPGPLEGGMVDDFILRKHGQKTVEYPHPWLEKILEETYGVIVYQEQVMQIASALAGYSLGMADILRRAMGKKKASEMDKQKKIFLAGAAEKEVDATIAEQVFDLMAVFAGYGFNKSHSAAYALISYQTAYLKCHHPVEFMAAVLTCDKDNTDNLTKYLGETRAMEMQVVRPDVAESAMNFSVHRVEDDPEGKQYIRFGMSAVRNVGEGAVEAIIEAREGGPFTGLFDFCERIDSRRVNRRVIEALIKSGGFDGICEVRGLTRARLLAALDAAHERAVAAQRDRESGQTSLFGMLDDAAGESGGAGLEEDEHKYPDVPEWEPRQRLAFEKEALGFYVSGHPLDRYEGDLRRHADATTGKLEKLPERAEVGVGGLVTDYRERPLKNGKGRMAIFALEDKQGAVEVVCFSRPFEEFEATLKSGEPLLVTGNLRFEGEGENRVPRMQLRKVVTLPALRRQKTKEMHLHFDADRVQVEQLGQLREVLLQHVGECRTLVTLTLPKRSKTTLVLSERFSVTPNDELLVALERLFGDQVARLR
jgi:DNA polymerase III subunit alpha